MSELNNTVLKILDKAKGILAADESTATMTKRLDGVNVPSTPENRLLFRETLFSASSMTECIGGVILYDETIRQNTSEGIPFPEYLSKNGIIPGIKVDKGAIPLCKDSEEKFKARLIIWKGDKLEKLSLNNEQSAKEAIKSIENSGLEVVKNEEKKEFRNAFCGVRPPGHHSSRNMAAGFCILNSVSIGANYLLKKRSFI